METELPRLGDIVASTRGVALIRLVQALGTTNGAPFAAAKYAEGQARWRSTPAVVECLKAAVAFGTTADSNFAKPLVASTLAREFIALLRPSTILGRMAGLRRVPFMTKVPKQTTSATVRWIGEGLPKEVSALSFGELTVPSTKMAALVVITAELARLSDPDAEALISRDMAGAIVAYTDSSFLNAALAPVAGKNPAGIVNGTTPIVSSGDPADDAAAAIGQVIGAGGELTAPYFIMRPATAAAIAAKQSVPTTTVTGGTLSGVPCIVSGSAPADTLTLVDAAQVLLADSGELDVSISSEASVMMDGAPVQGVTPHLNLWQNDLIGILCERYIWWGPIGDAEAAAAQVSGATYP